MLISRETKDDLTDDFWDSLDFVIAAVDNYDARKYLQDRCIWYNKPFFDAGLEGSRVSTFSSLPGKTKSYQTHETEKDTNRKKCIATAFLCTSDECVEWARWLFEEITSKSEGFPKQYNDFLDSLPANIQSISKLLEDPQEIAGLWNFDEMTLHFISLCQEPSQRSCLIFAKTLFERKFEKEILDMITRNPKDSVVDGKKFWSGNRIFPKSLSFDYSLPLHRDFIQALSSILSQMIQVKDPYEKLDEATISEILSTQDSTDLILRNSLQKLIQEDRPEIIHFKPIYFDKDDFSKNHIEFIVAAANLRCDNFNLPPVSHFDARIKAGEIQPALISAAAFASSLMGFEIIKLIGNQPLSSFRFSNSNLALDCRISFVELQKLQVMENQLMEISEHPEKPWTEWDCYNLEAPMTVQGIISHLLTKFNIKVDDIYIEGKWVYSQSEDSTMKEMDLEEAYAYKCEKTVPTQRKYLKIEVTPEKDENCQNKELPKMRYITKKGLHK